MIEPIGGNEMPKSFAQQIEDDENKIKRIRVWAFRTDC